MRAITITQPWAGLVASGIKLVENRVRPIISDALFGEPVAIHASRQIDESIYNRIMVIAPELRPRGPHGFFDDRWYKLSRISGSVIGVGVPIHTLAGGWTEDAIITHKAGLFEQLEALVGDGRQVRWFFGPVGHIFRRDMFALPEPVKCRGMLGCWTLPGDVEQAVRAQMPCEMGGTHSFVGGDVQCWKCLQEVR